MNVPPAPGVRAADPRRAHETLAPRVATGLLDEVLALVPDSWLEATDQLPDPPSVRATYRDHLLARLENVAAWLPAGAVA